MERPPPIGRVLLYGVAVFWGLALLARLGGTHVSWLAVVLPLPTLLVLVNVGVMVPRLGMFAQPILGVRPARARGKCALTFDDGPHPTQTMRILDELDKHGHKATFFIVGKYADALPEVLAEIVRRGHALGNHSWHHERTTPFAAPERLAEDLARVNDLIVRAQGRVTRWFRAPIGLVSPPVRKAAALAGLEIVGWTAKARDGWESTTVDSAARRLVAALRPGAILLLHDGTEQPDRTPIAADVLPKVLAAMASQQLKSVTIDELLDGARD